MTDDNMKVHYICSLEYEHNTCPFLSSDKKYCTNPNTRCSFRIEDKKEITKDKKEKWYIKYYK